MAGTVPVMAGGGLCGARPYSGDRRIIDRA